ncbi:MAG: TonB family protein [Bacteroidetes bacterium]|nr:TonB family protein [Bacteroidota bacterium]
MKRIILFVSLIVFIFLLVGGCSSSIISPPVLLNGCQPFYPLEARIKNLKGDVTLLLNISEKGSVSKVSVKKSSGSEILDNAAERYAKNLTFKPANNSIRDIPASVIWIVKFIPDNVSYRIKDFNVLVFSKTSGYRHQSIEKGMSALKTMALENNFEIDFTEDSTMITDKILSNYKVIVFLNTSGNVLGVNEENSLENYIKNGGGFVGIHAAVDTEYDWSWYGKMIGAYFSDHPEIQKATVNVVDKNNVSTKHLPDKWERIDEWYNLKNQLDENITVLANIDESTYSGGTMGDKHPFSWCHNFDGGRVWITLGGHTEENYSEINFLKHILGGIKYAADNN